MVTTRHVRAELASLDPQMAPALREIAILAARSADARTDWPPGEAEHEMYWVALAYDAISDMRHYWGISGVHRAAVALAWSRAGEDEQC